MYRNKSVNLHAFSMVPKSDVPRSRFRIQHTHKTTFDAGFLIPVYVDEVLPGDSFKVNMTAFARMSTPVFPVMDNLVMDSFFFFVPNRLVWSNWQRFMGEQDNPADSISFVVPSVQIPSNGFAVGSIFDFLGLPTVGQYGAFNSTRVNTLILRAYNLIWNQWFRDENLQNSVTVRLTDAGDVAGDFTLLRRGKRHDYFTSCLPWPLKGGVSVSLPLGGTAPVIGTSTRIVNWNDAGGVNKNVQGVNTATTVQLSSAATSTGNFLWPTSGVNLSADLTSATAATINQLRTAVQTQRLLEKEARGGTRYTEIVRVHFGVQSPDARLQRPEYLGGGSTPVQLSEIAQTSGTGATGTSAPLGNLAAVGRMVATGHGFSQSFTEHGHIIGLVVIRADLTYQQGVRKMWFRQTKYDFYLPVLQGLGEQAVLNQEIFCDGSANDVLVFGYQARWDEYRYFPSQITSVFRSTSAGTLDPWHLAQKFAALPTLNTTFIQDTPPLSRVLAAGAAANGQQFIFDSFWDGNVTRPMPQYGIPGMMDHF